MTSLSDNLRVSKLEVIISLFVIVGCITLHFSSVYVKWALPIEVTLSLISFVTPVSGLLYLSAAQVIPDPPHCPISSAQIALGGFIVGQIFSGNRANLLCAEVLCKTTAPFFIWCVGLSMIRGNYVFGPLLLFSLLTGCASLVLIKEARYRLAICIMAFLTGQAVAMCVYWILKLHLGVPVQAFNTDLYGDSTLEGIRIGTARGNANTLGPPMALVCVGIIGWLFNHPLRNVGSSLIATALLCIAVPPLIGSGSRGALVSVGLALIFITIHNALIGRSLGRTFLILLGAVGILSLVWQPLGLEERWQEISQRQEMEEHLTGGGLAAGRTLEWTAAWGGILDSPLLGGGSVVKLSFLNADEFMWVSHSTYLDVGLIGGFPGIALFAWLILRPILRLFRQRAVAIGWLLALYFTAIVSIGSTSSLQLKYFWILWGMTGIYFAKTLSSPTAGDDRIYRRPLRSMLHERKRNSKAETPQFDTPQV